MNDALEHIVKRQTPDHQKNSLDTPGEVAGSGKSEQSLIDTLSASPIGIGRVKKGIFDWVNDALCHITGYSPEELTGRHTRDLFETDEEYEALNNHLNARGWCESRLRKKSGDIIEVFAQAVSMGSSPGIITFVDVTHQSNAEKEQTTVGKLESLGVLAGGIAHDFNNILTMILGNITLAKMYMNTDPSKAHEKLVNGEQAIVRAKDLTQQLLTFSKGGAPIKKVLQIEDFLRDTCQFTLTGTPVVCRFDFAPDLPAVEIDEGQITQAIGHIVINGHQAMPEGGTILIKAECAAVDSSTNLRPGEYIKISITDQGVGIPDEHVNKIFDPYFTTKQKGSGLGLAISYSIIKNHRGHIAVQSTLGVGTSFHIYLPVFAGAVPLGKNEETSMMASGKKVLVMDDEDSIRDMIGDILAFHGYDVDFAEDGEEALSLYQNNTYDVVILDLTIPGGMGGKETMKELRRLDPHVKAIVSSGYSSDPIMSDYRKYGFKDVIAKPYRIEELGEVIERVINSRG